MIPDSENALARLHRLLDATARGSLNTKIERRWETYLFDGRYPGFQQTYLRVQRITAEARSLTLLLPDADETKEIALRIVNFTSEVCEVEQWGMTCGEFKEGVGGKLAIEVIAHCRDRVDLSEPVFDRDSLSMLRRLASAVRVVAGSDASLAPVFRMRVIELADAIKGYTEGGQLLGSRELIERWDLLVGFAVQHPNQVPPRSHRIQSELSQIATIIVTVAGLVSAPMMIEQGVDWIVQHVEPPLSAPVAPAPFHAPTLPT